MARARRDGPLVSRARNGDEDAWRDLYLLHNRRLVVWLATTPSGDVAAAPEDVAAEAWAVAASKIGGFSGSDDDFGGWLVAISRNLVSNHRKRVIRRRTDPDSEAGSDLRAPGPTAESAVVGQAHTRELLAHLSRREAEVIACIDVAGLDVAATARALGMSATAVRVARHRGLGRLRRIMQDGTES